MKLASTAILTVRPLDLAAPGAGKTA